MFKLLGMTLYLDNEVTSVSLTHSKKMLTRARIKTPKTLDTLNQSLAQLPVGVWWYKCQLGL